MIRLTINAFVMTALSLAELPVLATELEELASEGICSKAQDKSTDSVANKAVAVPRYPFAPADVLRPAASARGRAQTLVELGTNGCADGRLGEPPTDLDGVPRVRCRMHRLSPCAGLASAPRSVSALAERRALHLRGTQPGRHV